MWVSLTKNDFYKNIDIVNFKFSKTLNNNTNMGLHDSERVFMNSPCWHCHKWNEESADGCKAYNNIQM